MNFSIKQIFKNLNNEPGTVIAILGFLVELINACFPHFFPNNGLAVMTGMLAFILGNLANSNSPKNNTNNQNGPHNTP